MVGRSRKPLVTPQASFWHSVFDPCRSRRLSIAFQNTSTITGTRRLHGDTHGLHGDTHGLHGDTHGLHGDTHGLHGDTHGLHGDTHGLHGDTHGLHGDTRCGWPRGGWFGSERSVPCQLVWQERSLIASQLNWNLRPPVGLPNRSQSLLACGNTRSILQTNHLETWRNCGSRHTMSRWHPSGLYGDTQLVNSRGAAFSQAPQRQRSSRL